MFKTIIKFVSEARIELAKVTWPTRQTVINLTLVVIGVSLLFTLFIGGVDAVMTTGVKYLTATAARLSGPSQQVTAPPVNLELDDFAAEGVDVETQPVE
jgi:preprotein translocase SecE subunit